MRLFSEKVNPTFNSSGYNILTVKDYTEVFFDVYEFEINGSKFVAEKTGVLDDAPIVSIPVDYNNTTKQYDFVLNKGIQNVYFDPSTQSTPSHVKIYSLTEDVEEETDEVFLEDKKNAILEEIEKAKIAAAKYLAEVEKQNKRELVSYQTKREKALKEDIDKQKGILFDEFYSLVGELRERLSEESSDTAHNLKELIVDQLKKVSADINKQVVAAEKAIDVKLEERANELLNDVLLSEVKRSSKEVADKLNSQVKTIAENISTTLSSTKKQLEIDLNEKLQEISTELNAKDKAIVELNDNLTKQSNRALSRIGTVKTQLESTVSDVVSALTERIDSASTKLEQYYNDKIQLVESSVTDVTEQNKKHIIDLIKESHQSLQNDIANIKVTVPNIVIEKSNGKQEIDVAALRTELEKTVSNRFVNEISSLKRLIELSSGGGSVAMQFAAGGTMNGNLTVVGSISASQYLGLSIPSGDYLPLSGGTVTGDVSVTGLLSANRIGFNTGAGLTAGVGQLTWNDQDGTLDLGLKGGNVTLQIGQETVARVVNKTGADLLESQYRVVRIRSTAEGGAQGQRLAIVLAQANNDPNSVDTLGIVTEDISVNQEGFITTGGLVRNINTTGALQGETWLDGDVLYLSPTTPGVLTKVKPQAPNHTVVVGFVVYAHANQGKIFVKVDNGYEIDELHNVRITSVSANDVLKYNGVDGVWENSNTLSLSSLSANSMFVSGLPVATAVDPVRTTLTGDGILSSFSINGAANLINPSALIVAIDGVLQEPVVDYGVNNGIITFTDPLASGAKAVVISPTNTIQIGQVVPSDGSVTSEKIATGVTLTTPSLVGPVDISNQDASTDSRLMNRILTLMSSMNVLDLTSACTGQAQGTGATQRRNGGVLRWVDGDLNNTATVNSIHQINISTGSLEGPFDGQGAIKFNRRWILYKKITLSANTNVQQFFIFGRTAVGTNALGLPTSGNAVGWVLDSATSMRLWRCNSGVITYSDPFNPTLVSPANNTTAHHIWLECDGNNTLRIYVVARAFGTGTPTMPTTAQATISNLPVLAGAEIGAQLCLRATATSPASFSSQGLAEAKLINF